MGARALPREPAERRLARVQPSTGALRCRRKFLRFFPRGFQDTKYVDWERGYKADAHSAWQEILAPAAFRARLRAGDHAAIAADAVRIESRTNLLFSFEKMALRDAVRSPAGAKAFSSGLHDWLHGPGDERARFERWCGAVAALPRKQTRVLTWPLCTVFGFIARPDVHFFLKPNVTRLAAREYGFPFEYASRPSWETYASLLDWARLLGRDLADLGPRDMIDLQSFVWVQGSDEYEE
jgi:hypothetical protein